MDLLQEYKELYYKELELKDSMSGKIGTSVTLITILCTGHMFMWDIMIRLDFVIHPIPMIFLILEIVSVFYTCLSMYNFYKTYFRYKYRLVSIEGIRESIDNKKNVEKITIKVIDTNAWSWNRSREWCYSTVTEASFHLECPMSKCLGSTSGITYKQILTEMLAKHECHRRERLNCGGYGGYNLTFHCEWFVVLDISITYHECRNTLQRSS